MRAIRMASGHLVAREFLQRKTRTASAVWWSCNRWWSERNFITNLLKGIIHGSYNSQKNGIYCRVYGGELTFNHNRNTILLLAEIIGGRNDHLEKNGDQWATVKKCGRTTFVKHQPETWILNKVFEKHEALLNGKQLRQYEIGGIPITMMAVLIVWIRQNTPFPRRPQQNHVHTNFVENWKTDGLSNESTF